MFGVVNEVPVPMAEPPVDAANQLKFPALVVAPRVTVPASQRDPGVVVVTTGIVFTVAVTAVLVDTQVAVDAST